MRSLFVLVVRHTVFANLAIVFILAAGLMAFFSMVRELMPETSFDMVTVTVPYPGADPEEVEEGICLKIEEAVEGIEGIKRYTTFASENVGMALIECAQGYASAKVKEDVRDRVDQITTFPDDAEKPRVTEITNRLLVLLLCLYGEASERDLKETAERIKRDLVNLPGVSQVTVGDTRSLEMVIDLSEEKMRQFGVSFASVTAAIRRSSLDLPGGTLKTEGEEIRIRSLGRATTGREFASTVVVTRPDGVCVPLDRIATIRDDFKETPLQSRFMGKPCVTLIIFKTKEEDAVGIAREVQGYLPTLERSLPSGTHVVLMADLSKMVNQRITLLVRNGLLGLSFVFLVLWLFLDLRLGFWVSLGIPISIGGALAILAYYGQTVNMLSLFSLILVLGIVVDDAIVVGEAIYTHRRRGIPPREAAVGGVHEMAWPVIAAVITTIVAFVPLFFVSGGMGKMVWIIPMGVIAALAVSLLECLFLLPAHLSHLPDLQAPRKRQGLLAGPERLRRGFTDLFERFVADVFGPVLTRILAWRYALLGFVIALFLAAMGIVAGGHLKFVFFPQLDSDYLFAQVEFPEGTPPETTEEAVLQISAGAQKAQNRLLPPGGESLVKYMSTMVGAFSGFQPGTGGHLGEVYVELKGSEVRKTEAKKFLAAWEEASGPVPGAISVKYEIRGPHPAGKPLEFWLLGDDLKALRDAALAIQAHLRTHKGVYAIEDDFRPGKRELRIQLKPEAVPLGLTLGDLATQLRAGFFGSEANRIQRGTEDVRVWVRYPLQARNSLADLERVRIRTPRGAEIPLPAVAKWTLTDGVSKITRKNGKRRITVTAEVDDTRANAREIRETMKKNFFPQFEKDHPSVRYTLEGQAQETRETMIDLLKGFALAVLAMFLILATIFRSYVQPLLILFTVPFGLCGAVFSHLLLGYDLTIMSMFGVVALAGIVVNDAIILIEAFNTRIAKGNPFQKALVEGAQRRFRPVILTTITTFVGLAPLMAERSYQAKFLVPMAIAIAFGVVFATGLTLVLLPCLVGILNDVRRGLFWVRSGRWTPAEEVEPARKRIESDGEGA
ncbi:MAG: efflux RND transporter permease subunit [Planctomycetota bacterium]